MAEATNEAGGAPPKKKRAGGRRPGQKNKRQAHPEKHGWDAMRLAYVHDPTVSIASLARENGVDYALIQRRSAEEGWVAKRVEALAESSREIRSRAVAQLCDGFRINAMDGFAQISRLRKKALELYEKQLDPEAALPVTSDSVSQTQRRADGTLVRTTAKRARPLLDAHLIEVLARIEVQWAAMLYGFHKPGQGDEERTVTIE